MKHLLTLTFLSIFGLAFAQVPSYVPTNGLVGWWPFNGNANDESGNGNNGTVNGATLTADRFGVTNKAFSFDGVDDFIEVSGKILPINETSYSISFWVNPNVINSLQSIITESSPTPNNFDYNYAVNFTDKLNVGISDFFEFGGSSYTSVQSSSSLIANQWVFGCMINDTVLNHIKIYFNGNFQGSISSIWYSSLPNNTQIGRGIGGASGIPSAYMNGSLDDIGIWNRALTDCEIKDLYNSQLGSANTSSSTTQTAIDSYTWPVNNQTYTQSGIYTDTLVNAAGCDSIITLNLELDFTGIQTSNLTSLKLYPNPVQEVLHVEGLAGKEFEFEVLSIDGKLLQKGKSQGEISVKELRKGNYVLRIGQQVSFVKM